MATFKTNRYKSGYFSRGSDNNSNLIMCWDKIVIMLILQSYIFNWYNTYLLHYVLDITEEIISQFF